MPVTPAHAALALPLSRVAPALPLAPLVIGTLSPDFEYLLRLSPTGRFAHSLIGLVLFCVPVSLLAWGMWRAIVRPAFVRLLPPGMAAMMSVSARAAPGSVAALAGLGALAALLGALTHVAWDDFTHANGWAVAHLPALREEASLGWPLGVRWYGVLQHASSVVGMAVVVAWGATWVASVPPPARVFAPGQAARGLGVALALLSVAGGTGTLNALRASSDKLATVLGFAAVGAMAGLVLSVLLYGVLARTGRP